MIDGLILRYGTRLSIEDAAQILRISTSQVRQRVNSCHLTVVRDGRRQFVTIESVVRYSLQDHD